MQTKLTSLAGFVYFSLLTRLPHILLQPLQGCPVFDDSSSDIENSSSSRCSELDGSTIIQAGGAGGFVQIAAIGTTAPCDAQPAITSGNISAQSFIFSKITGFLRCGFGVEFCQRLLSSLLLLQRLP